MGQTLFIEDKDFFHQISHVLRSKYGDEIVLFNGDGFEYRYGISEITKKGINLKVIDKKKSVADPEITLNLYQALPNKYEKIEYIIQKGVEIGISSFIFFNSERSQNLVINEKKIERFKFIIKEALEQCGGNKIPELIFTDKLNFTTIQGENLVCHTESSPSLPKESNISSPSPKGSLLFEKNQINLFIGPEGGFSDKEITEFKNNNCKLINFGDRILRTETAGIVIGFYILNLKRVN